MSSLRDQIIENADPQISKVFIYKMSIECQAMIAEGMLLFRHGKLPIRTVSELSRSLQRIAEKQHQEDLAKWPDHGTIRRLYDKATDKELQAIVDQLKQKPKQKPKPKASRTK